MHPLITADELAVRLGEVSVFDIRWALTDPSHGRNTYRSGHVPGAVFVDLDTDLSAPPGPGRHPLPSIEEWETTLGHLGVTEDAEVVVYDDARGGVAARMWWMLRSIGHESTRLLDRGYQTWVEAGHEIETGENAPTPTLYRARRGFTGVVSLDELTGREVIDVRAPERYRGDVEPVDPKAGHIPGALNIPLTSNLTAEGYFADQTVLNDLYSDVGEEPVLSCGSGVNACHTALAMTLAGRPLPDIYVGSFSEWSSLDLPVNTGDRP